MLTRGSLLGWACACALLPSAPLAHAQDLKGPDGTSTSKVLVVGTDGTRIDLVRKVMAEGGAPNLKALGEDGFAVPSLLAYQLPQAATLSEVGWSTIATGVWPDKHGVNGVFLNNDPRQSTKNGYPDFLTRLEQVRPQLSTFLASDWGNIGQHVNGGPIFGDGIDARLALDAEGTIDAFDAADQQIADTTARYLRDGNPDAGFVYFGVVDECAHNDGSANPRYQQAIRDTDRRIGQLLTAIRARRTYLSERWLVIVTTDHGQQPLTYASPASHGFNSALERLSFVAAAGLGLQRAPFADIRVVDIAPTVFERLGLPVNHTWNLDGRSFSPEPEVPRPTISLRRFPGGRLRVLVKAPQGAPDLKGVHVGRRSFPAHGRRFRVVVRTGARRPTVTVASA